MNQCCHFRCDRYWIFPSHLPLLCCCRLGLTRPLPVDPAFCKYAQTFSQINIILQNYAMAIEQIFITKPCPVAVFRHIATMVSQLSHFILPFLSDVREIWAMSLIYQILQLVVMIVSKYHFPERDSIYPAQCCDQVMFSHHPLVLFTFEYSFQ